jgi:hypothetical protein
MLYGPETAYPTQRAGVKALVKSIVNNTSGRGPIYQWEIWMCSMLIKRYHANYNQGGGVTTKRTWGDVPGKAINATNQTY